jgi:6-phosphogluconolactonase
MTKPQIKPPTKHQTRHQTRRSFLTTATATLAATQLRAEDTAGPLVYAGGGSQKPGNGIHVGHWNAQTGTIVGYRSASNIASGFLAITHHGQQRFLFAGHPTAPKTGGLSSFRIEPSGDLTLINTVSTPGADFVHLACDHTGQCIIAPNYGKGFILSAKIALDGHLSEFVSRIQLTGHGPIADRQEAPHAHGAAIAPNNRFVYINDLGTDRIMVYKLNVETAELTPADIPFVTMPPGSGPRHLAFHPNGKWAYSINELNSTITLFHWNPTTGALTSIAAVPTMAAGGDVSKNRAGEIAFDAAGHFLYACNRGGAEDLPIYSVGSEGHLTFLARTPLAGKEARHFVVSPDDGYLLVANQFSNEVTVYTRDRHTGLLKITEAHYPLEDSSCILFA